MKKRRNSLEEEEGKGGLEAVRTVNGPEGKKGPFPGGGGKGSAKSPF